ncbi:MFS transporter [Clostridium estertheticum]|uniref:MFS transporter n=1 Tax=Clostridium estertheticum TaxID=238834 RepID=UPI001C6F077A|nr:MFS transporter [Clostridium estertheticum]MBW9172697.1 MFS transporter [Clostridium estertheticum]WLC73562.1 MFS transporter [Clostridium estertheticum]
MKNSRNSIYIVDFLMSFITVFGVVMFLSMFPHIQEVFGVSVSQISWIPNVAFLTMIIFAILVSKIINRVGIKKLLLISLILWIIGIVLEIVALSNLHFYVFVIGRFVEGIGEAFMFPLLLSMNKFELKTLGSEKIGLSLIEFGAALGGLISGIISGNFINNPRQFLIIPICFAIIVGVFIIIKLKPVVLIDTDTEIQNKEVKESNKAYISLVLMIFIIQTIFSSIQVYLAYYMDAISSPNLTGFVISIEQILLAIGTIAPIVILKKISLRTTRNIIFLIFVFGAFILSLQISIYLSILGFGIMAFCIGVGFTISNICVTKVISIKVSQKLSIYTAIRNAGGFVLSFVWGNMIANYHESGQSYGEIFRHLYTFEGIIVTGIFIIIIFMQKGEVMFKPEIVQNENI